MEDPEHMMPAPLDESGKCWRKRYLTSEEGAEFLRVILGVPKKSGRRISSHSLKSTTMSWASKFGLSLEIRAILSRHATAIAKTQRSYIPGTFCHQSFVNTMPCCKPSDKKALNLTRRGQARLRHASYQFTLLEHARVCW